MKCGDPLLHRLLTPREEIAFTARPKIHSHFQIFRYGQSIFCLPHRPNFSDIFDLCLHWVSVVRASTVVHKGTSNLAKSACQEVARLVTYAHTTDNQICRQLRPCPLIIFCKQKSILESFGFMNILLIDFL